MLSFIGKKKENKIFGNNSYAKCEIMEMIKMPMTAINFIFLRFIISSFINYINIMDRYLKIIIFMLQYLV